MSELSAASQKALQEKRRQYVASLSGRADDLDEYAKNARDYAEPIHLIAHRLAGSAGLYGLPQVQAAAVAVEEQLRKDQPLAELEAALTALSRALRDAS